MPPHPNSSKENPVIAIQFHVRRTGNGGSCLFQPSTSPWSVDGYPAKRVLETVETRWGVAGKYLSWRTIIVLTVGPVSREGMPPHDGSRGEIWRTFHGRRVRPRAEMGAGRCGESDGDYRMTSSSEESRYTVLAVHRLLAST